MKRHEWEDDEHYEWRKRFVAFLSDGPDMGTPGFAAGLEVYRDWHDDLRAAKP